jgi:hypothetical protein
MANTPIGVSIQEGIASGISSIQSASKHNVGLLMERERGIPNKPIRVTSLQEDRVRFGGVQATQYGAYVTRHLFKNVGTFGAILYGVRIVGTGSSTASVTVTDGAPTLETWTTVITVPAAPLTFEERTYTPADFSIGDAFSLQSGLTTVTYTVQAGDAAIDIVTGLQGLIAAQQTLLNPDWTDYATSIDPSGKLIVEHTIANTVITITPSVLSGGPNTIMTIYAAQEGVDDPGEWANDDLKVRLYPAGQATGLPDQILLEVIYKNRRVESWSGTKYTDIINLINQRSLYVRGVPAVAANDVIIYDILEFTLSGGTYTAPVEADFYPVPDDTNPLGLAIFDNADVQIVAVTEHFSLTMAQEGQTWAVNLAARPIYVHNLPYQSNTVIVEQFANLLQSTLESCTALYNFWCKTSDENNSSVWVPALGTIIGAGYIKVPGLNRDFIHTPPAGIESAFSDVQDIYPRELSKEVQTLWVKRYSSNIAIYKAGKGFFLFSSRTTSTNLLFQSIHIRRQTSYYARVLEDSLIWLVQKPATPENKRRAYVEIYNFMLNEYNNGALEGSVPFSDACQIDIQQDPSDRKFLRIVIDWIPTEAVESVRIELNRNDGILISSNSNNA